jgi:hypothetical protein
LLTICRNNRIACVASRRASVKARDRRPCFQLATRLRSFPSGVRGPVLMPPCIRQRPFGIAGDWHRVRLRVSAPQRGLWCISVAVLCTGYLAHIPLTPRVLRSLLPLLTLPATTACPPSFT